MNNRLKFRVWLPSLNKFGNDNSVFMDCYGKLYGVTRPSLVDDSRSIVNIGQFKEFSGHTIQWYTGLNDKDNNPIFEGDLVELHTATNDHAKNIKENHYGLYEIYWDRKYKLKEIKPNWFLKVIDDDCASFNIMKVVGNAFENPELLK